MKTITYSDLQISELDQHFIDRLMDEYNIYYDDLDITYVFDGDKFDSATLTNAIIHEIMRQIILDNVEDQDDIFDLEESIYTNCIDSHYDIDPEKLRTEDAKEVVRNFN